MKTFLWKSGFIFYVFFFWYKKPKCKVIFKNNGQIHTYVIYRRRQWHPTPVLLPGKSHGQRSLVGSPWGHGESDVTVWLHFHFSLLCIAEGNGNPPQCSSLENPRDGVAQSQTRLKWLSSSSNSSMLYIHVGGMTRKESCIYS